MSSTNRSSSQLKSAKFSRRAPNNGARTRSRSVGGGLRPRPQTSRAKTPARRRSVSKGRTNVGAHAVVREARAAASTVVKHQLYPAVKALRTESDYIIVKESKDVKSDPTVDLLLSQLSTARSMVRSALGNKPIRIDLAADSSAMLLAVVTTGQLKGIFALLPSVSAEFSALATLFDEVRVQGQTTHFTLPNAHNSLAASATSDDLFVMVFDPVDFTALASVASGAVLAQHKLFALGVVGPGSVIAGTVATLPNGRPHSFTSKTPPDIFMTGTTTLIEGAWTPCTAPGTYGYLKVYGFSTTVTAVNVGPALTIMHTEFRCRE